MSETDLIKWVVAGISRHLLYVNWLQLRTFNEEINSLVNTSFQEFYNYIITSAYQIGVFITYILWMS